MSYGMNAILPALQNELDTLLTQWVKNRNIPQETGGFIWTNKDGLLSSFIQSLQSNNYNPEMLPAQERMRLLTEFITNFIRTQQSQQHQQQQQYSGYGGNFGRGGYPGGMQGGGFMQGATGGGGYPGGMQGGGFMQGAMGGGVSAFAQPHPSYSQQPNLQSAFAQPPQKQTTENPPNYQQQGQDNQPAQQSQEQEYEETSMVNYKKCVVEETEKPGMIPKVYRAVTVEKENDICYARVKVAPNKSGYDAVLEALKKFPYVKENHLMNYLLVIEYRKVFGLLFVSETVRKQFQRLATEVKDCSSAYAKLDSFTECIRQMPGLIYDFMKSYVQKRVFQMSLAGGFDTVTENKNYPTRPLFNTYEGVEEFKDITAESEAIKDVFAHPKASVNRIKAMICTAIDELAQAEIISPHNISEIMEIPSIVEGYLNKKDRDKFNRAVSHLRDPKTASSTSGDAANNIKEIVGKIGLIKIPSFAIYTDNTPVMTLQDMSISIFSGMVPDRPKVGILEPKFSLPATVLLHEEFAGKDVFKENIIPWDTYLDLEHKGILNVTVASDVTGAMIFMTTQTPEFR